MRIIVDVTHDPDTDSLSIETSFYHPTDMDTSLAELFVGEYLHIAAREMVGQQADQMCEAHRSMTPDNVKLVEWPGRPDSEQVSG